MAKNTNKYQRWEPLINIPLYLAVEFNPLLFTFKALKVYLQIPTRFL